MSSTWLGMSFFFSHSPPPLAVMHMYGHRGRWARAGPPSRCLGESGIGGLGLSLSSGSGLQLRCCIIHIILIFVNRPGVFRAPDDIYFILFWQGICIGGEKRGKFHQRIKHLEQ